MLEGRFTLLSRDSGGSREKWTASVFGSKDFLGFPALGMGIDQGVFSRLDAFKSMWSGRVA